jgi:hypothetical protein
MQSKLEKEIYDKVHGYDEPINLDAIWTNVESQLTKSKKKRPVAIWFWALLGLGLTALLSISLIENKSFKSSNANNTDVVKQHDNHPIQNSPAQSTNDRIAYSTLKAEPIKNNRANDKGASAIVNTTLAHKITTTKSQNIFSQNHSKGSLQPTTFKSEATSFEQSTSTPPVVESTSYEVQPVINSTIAAQYNDETINEDHTNEPFITSAVANSTPLLPSLLLSPLAYTHNPKSMNIPIISLAQIKPIKNQNKQHSISFTTAYYINRSNLELTNTNLTNEYNKRKSEEKAKDALSFAIGYTRPFYFNTSLTLGIAYMHMWDKRTTPVTVVTTKNIDNILIDRVVTPGGTIDSYGSQSVTITSRYLSTRYNHYADWYVPVEWTKDIRYRRMSMDIGVGVDIVFNRSYIGSIYHNDGEYDLSIDDQQLYTKSLNLRLKSILGIKYNFSTNISLGLRAKYILPTYSLTSRSYGIDHYQRLYGIESGLYYNF